MDSLTDAALARSSSIRSASILTAASSAAVCGLPDFAEARAASQSPSAAASGAPDFFTAKVR